MHQFIEDEETEKATQNDKAIVETDVLKSLETVNAVTELDWRGYTSG